MMRNETISADCLFLHDTQMAVLEQEQRDIRFLADSAESLSAAPFFPALPLCIPAPGRGLRGKLEIAAPREISGWIARPVSGEGEPDGVPEGEPSGIRLPGYPPLPTGCFILGYAGERAAGLIEEDAKKRGERRQAFRANARYRATVKLDFSFDDGPFYGCRWTVGPARWESSKREKDRD